MARRYSDEELRSILAGFGRLKISVYGFDRDEYKSMTRQDEYEATTEQITRILALAPPGVVVVGLRNLKNRRAG